jgi:hypothetical protein
VQDHIGSLDPARTIGRRGHAEGVVIARPGRPGTPGALGSQRFAPGDRAAGSPRVAAGRRNATASA